MKIGRTYLADATPLTLGQEIGGMARQFDLAVSRAEEALRQVLELPIGGTAVGTYVETYIDIDIDIDTCINASVRSDGNLTIS